MASQNEQVPNRWDFRDKEEISCSLKHFHIVLLVLEVLLTGIKHSILYLVLTINIRVVSNTLTYVQREG